MIKLADTGREQAPNRNSTPLSSFWCFFIRVVLSQKLFSGLSCHACRRSRDNIRQQQIPRERRHVASVECIPNLITYVPFEQISELNPTTQPILKLLLLAPFWWTSRLYLQDRGVTGFEGAGVGDPDSYQLGFGWVWEGSFISVSYYIILFFLGDLRMTWLPRSAAGVRSMAWFSLRTPKVMKM